MRGYPALISMKNVTRRGFLKLSGIVGALGALATIPGVVAKAEEIIEENVDTLTEETGYISSDFQQELWYKGTLSATNTPTAMPEDVGLCMVNTVYIDSDGFVTPGNNGYPIGYALSSSEDGIVTVELGERMI